MRLLQKSAWRRFFLFRNPSEEIYRAQIDNTAESNVDDEFAVATDIVQYLRIGVVAR